MSDEEKKAIKSLKTEYEKLIKEGNILFPLYKSDAKRLIDIIEKQQKEIEEFKDKFSDEKIRNIVIKRYKEVIEKDYVSKDKIKAKIEEIDEILNNNILIEKLKVYYEAQKEFGQSLLEKE